MIVKLGSREFLKSKMGLMIAIDNIKVIYLEKKKSTFVKVVMIDGSVYGLLKEQLLTDMQVSHEHA